MILARFADLEVERLKKEKSFVKIGLIIHLILINLILFLVFNLATSSEQNIDIQKLFTMKGYETYWELSEKIISDKKNSQR